MEGRLKKGEVKWKDEGERLRTCVEVGANKTVMVIYQAALT